MVKGALKLDARLSGHNPRDWTGGGVGQCRNGLLSSDEGGIPDVGLLPSGWDWIPGFVERCSDARMTAAGQVWGEAEVQGPVILHGPELDVSYKLANGTFVGDQSFPKPAQTTYSSEPTLDALPATYTIAWAVGRLEAAVVSPGAQAAAGLYAAPGTPRTDPYNSDWRLDAASGDFVAPPPLASARAFCVWRSDSGITQLFSGGKPDQNTVAMCIANDGTVVGTSDLLTPKHPADPGNAKHLFVAIAGSAPVDIYNLIPPSLLGQVRIESALDISSDGTKLLLKGQTLEGGLSPAWVPRTLLLARDEQKLRIVDAKGASPMKINNTKVLAGYIPKPLNVISAGILLPVETMVDANRDEEMSFTDAATHDKDGTTAQKPYKFWLNNDHDEGKTVDTVDWEEDDYPGAQDSGDNEVKWKRDLEDLTRLWISFNGITEMVKSPGFQLQLEWKPMDGGTSWVPDACRIPFK